MNEAQVRDLLAEVTARMDANSGYEQREPEFVLEFPQSGERFRGREAVRAMQAAYPQHGTLPTMHVSRVLGAGDLWILEGWNDYGGQRSYTVNIVEFRGDKMLRETRYYAEPFAAPAWRAEMAERIEDGT